MSIDVNSKFTAPEAAISFKPFTLPASQETTPTVATATKKSNHTPPAAHGKTRGFTASDKHPPTALNKLQQNKGGTPAWLEKHMTTKGNKTAKTGSHQPSKQAGKADAPIAAKAKHHAPVNARKDMHTEIRLLKMSHQRHTTANARVSKHAPEAKLTRAPKNQSQVASLFVHSPEKSPVPKRLDPSKLPKQPWKTVPGYHGPMPVHVAHAGKPHGPLPVKVASRQKS